MNLQNDKCVMVFDETLPYGIIANAAAIMGMTLGKYKPEYVGSSVFDQTQNEHLGIIAIPIPILKTSSENLKEMREVLYTPQFHDLTVVDFSDIAQSCNIYDEYIKKASQTMGSDFHYFGIAMCGPKKLVNKLTGSLPLLK
ncbi:DUF2000 domain-containing protein [Candidatus Stoquefichus massiliensis]|uniref:DUF2000 domain-containing protein n=1 Tax=Candidatus Stoquefichus massiliensis TaxID=1470350 RepID=UPI000481C1EB|nr:DUF2000 domain-containing protein [Candidatus Stoquefichus massiliensis]